MCLSKEKEKQSKWSNHIKYTKQKQLHKQPDGIEGGGGPATEVTEATSIFTGLWLVVRFATPGRLKVERASMKFSEIRTRK